MQKFYHFLFFSVLIPHAILAPITPTTKSDLETLIRQTLKLSSNITTDLGKDRKVKIVSEEFNREDPKCLQTHIQTFIDGLHEKHQEIRKNLEEIAARFNATLCPSLNETSCSSDETDYQRFKTQLIQFLKEIPSDCQNLKPPSSIKS